MSEQIMQGKDATGAPRAVSVDNTGALNTNASLSASSLAINDKNTPANTLSIDGTGAAKVTFSAATVTANAGTNLNTSLLALETGGNLAGIKTDADSIVTNTSNTATNTSTTATNTGNCATVEGTTADAAVTTNTTGTISGKLRGLVAILADVWDSTNHLFAQNIKQINGVVPLMGNGTTGTGSQRVTIASDNTAFSVNAVESGTWTVGSNSATGSAVPANAFYKAGIAKTALPSAASDGNLTGAMVDKFGRQVVLPGTIRDLVGSSTTTISASTSETTIVAQTASTFHDLTALMISNTSATAARVDFRDTTAGSVLFSIYVPAGDVRGIVFSTPQPQTTVNTNWTAQSSASVTDLRIFAQYISNK